MSAKAKRGKTKPDSTTQGSTRPWGRRFPPAIPWLSATAPVRSRLRAPSTAKLPSSIWKTSRLPAANAGAETAPPYLRASMKTAFSPSMLWAVSGIQVPS
jgi:hypothetical protein